MIRLASSVAQLRFVAVLSLLALAPALFASDEPPATRPIVASAVSAAVPMVSTLVSFVPLAAPGAGGIAPWIANPILLGSHIPMYWLDPGRAGWYTAAGLGLPSVGIGLMFAGGGSPLAVEWSMTALQAYANLMRASSYDVSLESRQLLPEEDPWHLDSHDPEVARGRVGRWFAAPFGKTVVHPLVWIPSVAAPIVLSTYYRLFEYEGAQSVAAAGHGYIGATEVSVLASGTYNTAKSAVDMLMVSVGEEAYYRGVVYDWLQIRYGRTRARVLDALLFPLIHLPSDLQSGFKPQTVAFNFLWRSGMTVVFDAAYDAGGVPLSISTHFWSDFLLAMSRWFFYGGSLPDSSS